MRGSRPIAVGISSRMQTTAVSCSRRTASQRLKSASVPARMVRTTAPVPRSACQAIGRVIARSKASAIAASRRRWARRSAAVATSAPARMPKSPKPAQRPMRPKAPARWPARRPCGRRGSARRAGRRRAGRRPRRARSRATARGRAARRRGGDGEGGHGREDRAAHARRPACGSGQRPSLLSERRPRGSSRSAIADRDAPAQGCRIPIRADGTRRPCRPPAFAYGRRTGRGNASPHRSGETATRAARGAAFSCRKARAWRQVDTMGLLVSGARLRRVRLRPRVLALRVGVWKRGLRRSRDRGGRSAPNSPARPVSASICRVMQTPTSR